MDLLDKVTALEHDAAEFGFKWENTSQIMHQIQNECAEIQEHLMQMSHPDGLQEEIGDLLHAVFSLCVFCKFSPKETLAASMEKFERRMNSVKAQAREQGLTNLQGHSFESLMSFWDKAKELVG